MRCLRCDLRIYEVLGQEPVDSSFTDNPLKEPWLRVTAGHLQRGRKEVMSASPSSPRFKAPREAAFRSHRKSHKKVEGPTAPNRAAATSCQQIVGALSHLRSPDMKDRPRIGKEIRYRSMGSLSRTPAGRVAAQEAWQRRKRTVNTRLLLETHEDPTLLISTGCHLIRAASENPSSLDGEKIESCISCFG
ncbi:hypothetical protein GN956_G23453 [Arapaima gigas]